MTVPTEKFAIMTPVAEHTKTEMCGGCGNYDPAKRCIGCLHEFTPAAPVAERDGLTALERLRLHVHDHETFPFFPEDAEEILEEYEVALTELQHRRAAEADDGMSCSCGGGSLVGHASGCPEAAASPSSPATGVRVSEAMLNSALIAQHDGDPNWRKRYDATAIRIRTEDMTRALIAALGEQS